MRNAHTQWDGRYKDAITRNLPEKLLSIEINTRQRYERSYPSAFMTGQDVVTPDGRLHVSYAVLRDYPRKEWVYHFEFYGKVEIKERGVVIGHALGWQKRKWTESELLPLQLATVPVIPSTVSPTGEKQAEIEDAFEIQCQRLVRAGEVD